MITQDRLKELLDYNPLTGIFTWKVIRPGASKGSIAGYLNKDTGYLHIRIDRKIYSQHRLAWFYMKGVWPAEVDHRDTNRANNKWINLREATESQNGANKGANRSNKLGVKGVYMVGSKFRASITFKGKQKHLGTFDTLALAKSAYDNEAKILFGDFFRS